MTAYDTHYYYNNSVHCVKEILGDWVAVGYARVLAWGWGKVTDTPLAKTANGAPQFFALTSRLGHSSRRSDG